MRQLLNHSAGLHQLRDVIADAYEMLDWDLVCTRLAAEAPRYAPGTRHGYHGITYGFLVGEVIRRVTGMTRARRGGDRDREAARPRRHVDRRAARSARTASPSSSCGSATRSASSASRCAPRASRGCGPRSTRSSCPGSDRLFASSDDPRQSDPRGQRLLHRPLARAHVRRARGRRRARRRALPLGRDAAPRDGDPDDAGSTSSSASR